jgi:hypothetical protein
LQIIITLNAFYYSRDYEYDPNLDRYDEKDLDDKEYDEMGPEVNF